MSPNVEAVVAPAGAQQKWSALVSRLDGSGRRELQRQKIETGQVSLQDYFDGVVRLAATGDARCRTLLSANSFQVLILLIVDPELTERTTAIDWAARSATWVTALDSKLLGAITRDQVDDPADEGEAIRALEVADALGVSARNLTLLSKFLHSKRSHIRSRATMMAGHATQNSEWSRKQLRDPDPRVRANTLDGLLKQTHLEIRKFLDVLEEAARDSHHRVSSTALLLLGRLGRTDAETRLRDMASDPSPQRRGAAEWALRQLLSASTEGDSPVRATPAPVDPPSAK